MTGWLLGSGKTTAIQSLQFNTNKFQQVTSSNVALLFDEIIYQKIKDQQCTIGHLKYLINDGAEQFKTSGIYLTYKILL